MRLFTAASLFDGQALIDDGAVLVDDDGVVRDVGPTRDVAARTPVAPERVEGLIVPGLVDAFAVLRDAHLRGKTKLGAGFGPWLDSVRLGRALADDGEVDDARLRAIDALVANGVAAVADVTFDEPSSRALARAGIASVTIRQIYGEDRYAATVALETAVSAAPRGQRWVPSPHAITTTHPDVARVALREARRRGGPAVLQVHVSPAGATADDTNALDQLADLGALEEGTLLAHVGAMSGASLTRVVDARTRVVICPRAALAIEVRLPPISAMVAAGWFPALGTGSAGAGGGNDVLAEAKAVAERFPALSSVEILRMATSAGADALGFDRHGRFAVGARPGVLLLEGTPPKGVVDGARYSLTRPPSSRRWLVPPAAEAAQTTTAHEA